MVVAVVDADDAGWKKPQDQEPPVLYISRSYLDKASSAPNPCHKTVTIPTPHAVRSRTGPILGLGYQDGPQTSRRRGEIHMALAGFSGGAAILGRSLFASMGCSPAGTIRLSEPWCPQVPYLGIHIMKSYCEVCVGSRMVGDVYVHVCKKNTKIQGTQLRKWATYYHPCPATRGGMGWTQSCTWGMFLKFVPR